MKFKIGDKVRILDGSKIEDYAGYWIAGMINTIGKVDVVRRCFMYKGLPAYELTNYSYTYDERGLELVEEEQPKVEVKAKESKAHFMKVAAEVTHDKFKDLIAKCPELVLLLAMFSSELANALFD